MDLLEILKTRFEENRHRHPELEWETVEGRLRDRPDCRMVLQRMEDTGGEPDVIGTDDDGKILFGDCSRETPSGRRSLCYDDEALRKRKKNPPSGSAVQQACEMGTELMDEALYRKLQMLEEFDLRTSSWIRRWAEHCSARSGTESSSCSTTARIPIIPCGDGEAYCVYRTAVIRQDVIY